MRHIYGIIDRMYLGSEFHQFWARCGRHDPVHPEDASNLQDSPFAHAYLPCPFDGPLQKARVVICLANPNYPLGDVDYRDLILEQRSGEESLPKTWDNYYEPRIARPMGVAMDQLRDLVSVFNVCPYASTEMAAVHQRRAAGLASIWQAQKFFREVLLPRARTGNIYLLVVRKHQLWGVTEGDSCPTYGVIRGNEMWGGIPQERAKHLHEWLTKKRYVVDKTSQSLRESEVFVNCTSY